MRFHVTDVSITSIADAVNTRSIPQTSAYHDSVHRIQVLEPHISAFMTTCNSRNSHRLSFSGPLAGVPFAIKDNICTSTSPTTAGSATLDDYLSLHTAKVVQRLLDAGGILIGKTNLDEFGMGASTENSAHKITRNPWNLERVPGGSSGGSAAAVAARMVPFALGTDTGGSVRQPAAFCGVTGLRPSPGRVSRHGLLMYSDSFDTIGPIAPSVADCALVLNVMTGYYENGGDNNKELPNFITHLSDGDLSGVRIGIISDGFDEKVQPEVQQCVKDGINVLKTLGAKVSNVNIGWLRAVSAAYFVIASAEAKINLNALLGPRGKALEKMGDKAKLRYVLGTYVLANNDSSGFLAKARRVQEKLKRRIDNVFQEGYDVLVSPTSPSVAFELGAKVDNSVNMYLEDIVVIPASMAGLPALSIPCGFANGLPVGMQIVAPVDEEKKMLKVGHAFQLATNYHLQVPNDVLKILQS